MITKITKEQEALIPQFLDEYLKIGLSTEPINLDAMKPVIESWYRHIKQESPAYFVFSSPAICSIFCAAVLPQLHSQLDSQLDRQLDSQLHSQLYSQLYSQLGRQLGSQLYSQLHSQLGSAYDSNYWYTNLAGAWIAFYRCGGMWGVEYTPEIKIYLEQWDTMARNGFHWWPRVGVAVCSQRPTYISMIDGRLHADGRKAVEFSDGWGVYSVNGVRLPENYGEKKIADWNPEWILKEENQEIRRVLLENIPNEKVANVLDLQLIDTYQSDVSKYELVEARNNPYPSRYRALRMTCPSTNKPYLIRVEPDMDSAEKALVKFNGGVHPDRFLVEH